MEKKGAYPLGENFVTARAFLSEGEYDMRAYDKNDQMLPITFYEGSVDNVGPYYGAQVTKEMAPITFKARRNSSNATPVIYSIEDIQNALQKEVYRDPMHSDVKE